MAQLETNNFVDLSHPLLISADFPQGETMLSDDPETINDFLQMAQKDGISLDAAKAVQEHGLKVAHAAYTTWKNNGKISSYHDSIKEILILKGERK